MGQVRTRMAPSPTGEFHIGSVHTSLFNFLLARKYQGVFVLRIDDTDRQRSKPEYVEDIKQSLRWLGLEWDEGPEKNGPHAPYFQSQRADLYRAYWQKLIDLGYAYRCFCTAEQLEQEKAQSRAKKQAVYRYSGRCRHLTEEEIKNKLDQGLPFTIRMKTDWLEEVVVHDLIRGTVRVKASEIGDFIIVRSDGTPVLLLTSTVDDIEMAITHAIRGEDMLNVTFRMYFIFKALGKDLPGYAHKPFLYATDGKKLSKRHGATSVTEFRNQGYLPEAILNYLFMVGYTPSNPEKEFYTLDEMIQDFDFSHFQTGMPRFDYQKLNWYNKHYIKQLPADQLAQLLLPYLQEKYPQVNLADVQPLVPLVQQRLTTLSEIVSLAGFIFDHSSQLDYSQVKWKAAAKQQLTAVHQQLSQLSDWQTDQLDQVFQQLIQQHNWKVGGFFMNLRQAVAGQKITPPITESISLMPRQLVLDRLSAALQTLDSTS